MQSRDNSHQALRETITAGEAAKILGMSEWSVYDLARRRLIPHVRPAGMRRVFFRRSTLLAWLEAQEAASVQQKEPALEKIRRLK
ncbi:helix-turn-helix domain-containing protein [Moorella naiadis]|uniref:helix-turn-helix transcriptional regulator n=1 Tax=Moorella naiadis (nom. illeg.) TaxID=3093670 RepID=UPI003D9C85C8